MLKSAYRQCIIHIVYPIGYLGPFFTKYIDNCSETVGLESVVRHTLKIADALNIVYW